VHKQSKSNEEDGDVKEWGGVGDNYMENMLLHIFCTARLHKQQLAERKLNP
jgi:hypothetical protein